jgi:membrane protease YdiL (CAAX protease family)
VRTINRFLLHRPLATFFLLAYGISWALELPALLQHDQGGKSLADGALFLFLGSFGPSLAALMLTAFGGGTAGVKKLLKGYLPWRADFIWYLIALYGFLALGLLTILLLDVASPQDVLSRLPLALVSVPANALTTFLILGPLGEELGWRGFALPRLQAGRTALEASVKLGLLWAFWHLPLMRFAEWRGDLSLGAFVVLYPLYIIALTIIFTCVYNHTRASIMVATVLHSAFNYTLFFLDQTFSFTQYDPLLVQAVVTGLLWCVAVALIGAYGPDLQPRAGRR